MNDLNNIIPDDYTKLKNDCIAANSGEVITRNFISFEELFEVKQPEEMKYRSLWYNLEIYAKTNKDFTMRVWNQVHPVEGNTTEHTCASGTRVRVWMVSRFGDIGITDNIVNPIGYDCRGVDVEDLTNWEFVKIR